MFKKFDIKIIVTILVILFVIFSIGCIYIDTVSLNILIENWLDKPSNNITVRDLGILGIILVFFNNGWRK